MTPRLLILGATGSLGRYVLRQALAAGVEVSVLVRNPDRLPSEVRHRLSIHAGDLEGPLAPDIVRGHDALINCAGNVADGQGFVDLVDGVIAGAESLQPAQRPVCWFLAGAALLDLDSTGRRGVDLPQVSATYWPHRVNLERLDRSDLDWRLLCPGPMVEQPAIGLHRLRTSIDRLPVQLAEDTYTLPDPLVLSQFVARIPEMRVPYADAAALMLANLDRASIMTRHRVGLALPASIANIGQ